MQLYTVKTYNLVADEIMPLCERRADNLIGNAVGRKPQLARQAVGRGLPSKWGHARQRGLAQRCTPAMAAGLDACRTRVSSTRAQGAPGAILY